MKTTKKNFDFFSKWVTNFASYFHLGDWEFSLEHAELVGKWEEHLATVAYNIDARHVLISLNKEWAGDEITNSKLARVAMEEVLHVLIGRLAIFASRIMASDIIDEEEHAIIARLQNAMFDDLYKRLK